ncbi:furry-like protein [Dermatophagoides farinae]|uniref:Furry-like protein n=1 Tax=Dermatophagoides farinae TaxID=6954 RepID=A0A9D4SHZ4_DERFA|nr:furry-like protein [Dermatophagoides farinae]
MNHFENNNNNNLPEKPGEVILRKLFHEFTILTGKKIDTILTSESLEKPLAKWLQRGEDPIFDQLLTAFGTAAEHCLPSQLRLLFEWYQRQIDATDVFAEENQRIIKTNQEAQFSSKSGSLTKSNIQSLDNSDIEIYYLLEKRDLAVEFIFCLVLIEVLKQLPLHPGYDDLTNHIEKLAFKHFKFREDAQSNPNLVNINMIADLYAEVIGVLAHSRFQSVRKCFMNEFNELRSRDPGPITTHSIISLLMGMKFFRIKMVPIEEFEASFQFMHECAQYFQEVKDKDIKHALAGLFVEILVPVAATVKNEVNVPCLKNFVELLYSPCLDLCTKKKHCLALFPLVTCLLCVSQKAFFLTNWHYFLAMCLGHLKNRDPKMSRVALESLYRLLWVYMIRIKCESNTATQTRLHSIVNSLFPKGSKGVVPRDTPLNIFVKIIQFIAQERLDFAMKEIVFDLLSVGRSIKMVLTPERMSIGLRSFLVVADSLQQKDGEPPMPRTLGVLPSGNTLRVKKTFLNKMLTDEMAKNIGMSHYYPYVRKTLSDILRALDQQFGRPLMMTSIQNVKEPDDMISGERKPKIDLFRTCVAAIPRLIPDGISKSDLIDLLARLTINIDEEMNVLAFQALQNLVVDFADWREDVIEGFINFILHEIQDSNQDLLMNSLRMLLQLLTSWKNTVQQQQQQQQQQHQQTNPVLLNNIPEIIGSSSKSSIHQNLQAKMDQNANVLYNVEGLALVMLCHYRQPNRRLASYILKEVRFISNLLLHGNNNNNNKNYDEPVATIIDVTCPMIIENCFPYISSSERQSIIAMSYQIDLQWLAERTNNSWISDRNIDPNPVNDNRASSILRTTSNLKRSISSYERNFYLELWKSYLMFACSIAPSSIAVSSYLSNVNNDNCASPDSLSSEKLSSSIEGSRSPIMNRGSSAQNLFKQTIPLLRAEQFDLRNAVILGLSQINPYALPDLLEELMPYFREAIDKKQENLRRRKRREMLRIQIGRLFKFISERKIFAQCPIGLSLTLIEYIDGLRSYFESETDKECNTNDIKESFCHFICNLIKSFPIETRESKLSRELPTIFSIREYPCDRYIAIIIVTMINVACPRIEIQQLALQLLQILDNRFFFNSSNNFHDHNRSGTSIKGFEPLLIDLYCYSMFTISKRMAILHPQLTMIVFSEITYRIQTALPNVCHNLLQFLIPWLYNMQLVDTTCQPNIAQQNPDYSYSHDDDDHHHYQQNYYRYGWGSIESTQMILNNLLYITVKFGDNYPEELEKIWASLCQNRPANLKIIFRYLFILTGLSPNELLPYAKRIAIYLARAQPERVIDELMADLQAVELLSFNAERTEAFPYFRIVHRKCSATHLDDNDYCNNNNNNHGNGTLHTKRHSKDFHTKSYDHDTLNMNGAATATTTTNNTITTTTTATTITNKSIDQYRNFDSLNGSSSSDEYNGSIELPNDDSLPISDRYIMKPSTPQPRPLPMPEYGGYYAPLKELLSGKDCMNNNNNNNNLGLPGQQQQQQQAIGFHRCFLALMLMSDVITQDIHVDWTPHIPLMLHIIFLGMDHSKPIVYEHCKQLLLNLLVACCKHEDNLTVARILLKNRIQQQNFGLSIQNNILLNFQSNNVNDQSNNNNNHTAGGGERKNPSELDLDKIFTKSNDSDNVDDDQTAFNDDDDDEEDEENEEKSTNRNDENVDSKQNDNRPQRFSLDLYIKTLIDFISSKRGGPLWNNEDITAKVWSIRSAEQLSTFVEHVLCVFKESLPFAKIENRWADIGLWQALQCSSRHYAGRSLQIFRALKIPINRSMLSDILSRLVETVSEQGEDMQGYVTELMLTLESALDTLDLKPRSILELINQYFHFDTDSKTDVAADNSEQPQQPQQDKTNEQLEEKQDFQIDIDQQLQQQQQQQMVNRLYPAESSATLVAGTNTIRPSRAMAKHLMKVPARSNTSYSMSFPTRRFNFLDEHRPRFCTTKDVDSFYNDNRNSKGNSLANVSLGRSQSAQSLKNPPEEEDDDNQSYSLDDKNSMLAQFFCIGVIILETDYEHEFLLAIRLLDKCLQKMSLDDPECREKIEKIFVHIKWPNFSGVHQLLLKGLASNLCYEPTINLLHKLTPYLKISVIDPKKSETAFPFHVMAMLPYLLHNYDDPNVLCIQAAVSFAAWCNEHSNINLENLATVMTLYSKHCFSKENSQWTKCVVKYLYDAYPGSFVMIISFLVEVAEKGPAVFLNHILSILHFMLNYIDLNSSSRSINDDLMRVATKYIEGPQWKEALKILKLAVTRSSTLAAPSYSSNSTYASSIISSIVSCGSYSDGMSMTSSTFSESEFGSIGSSIKRELPGRTMDFTFDISQTPIVGAKFIAKRQAMTEMAANHNTSKDFGTDSAISSIATSIDNNNGGGGGSSSGVSNSIGDRNEKSDFILHKLFEVRDNFPIDNNDNESIPSNENSTTNADTIGGHNVNVDNNSTLKRSSLVATQTRIRERLVNLFNRCGKRIVGLPKSPSVIFSQNSDVGMDNHKSSMASSTEDMSATNNDVSGDSKHDDTAHGEFAYFKEFDFLEYELESQEGESLDNFNWGVRRKSLSNLDNDDISSNKTNKMNDEITNVTFEPSTSSMMMMMNSYSPRLSKNDVDECSSDDEVESVSPLYDLSSHHNQIPVFNENSSTHSRPASLISHGSSHSLVSEPELSLMNTVSSSIAAANHQPIILLSNPEAEEQCSKYFMQIINDHSGRMMAQANCLIVKILKNTFKRVIYLTRESCELLTQNVNNHMDNNNQQQQQQYGSIANRFMDLLDIISMQNDFPFIHMNERLFTMIDNLLKEQQFVIMGLHAHWETFNEKKDQLFGCILECKNFKMNNNNNNTESSSSSLDSTLISKLCQHLYRMHFQLYLLYECYLKFIDSIKSIHNYPMVINHSNEIGELKKNLIKYIGDDHHTTTTTDQQYSFSSIVSSMTTISKENEAELRDLIQTKQYSSAIQFVKILKNMMMISSGMEYNLGDIIRQLMDTSFVIYNNCPN